MSAREKAIVGEQEARRALGRVDADLADVDVDIERNRRLSDELGAPPARRRRVYGRVDVCGLAAFLVLDSVASFLSTQLLPLGWAGGTVGRWVIAVAFATIILFAGKTWGERWYAVTSGTSAHRVLQAEAGVVVAVILALAFQRAYEFTRLSEVTPLGAATFSFALAGVTFLSWRFAAVLGGRIAARAAETEPALTPRAHRRARRALDAEHDRLVQRRSAIEQRRTELERDRDRAHHEHMEAIVDRTNARIEQHAAAAASTLNAFRAWVGNPVPAKREHLVGFDPMQEEDR